MKKFLSIIFTLILALSISACSKENTVGESKIIQTLPTFNIKIGDEKIFTSEELMTKGNLSYSVDIQSGTKYSLKYVNIGESEPINYSIITDNKNVEIKKNDDEILLNAKTVGTTKVTISFDNEFKDKKININVNIKPNKFDITAKHIVDTDTKISEENIKIYADGYYNQIILNSKNGDKDIQGVTYEVEPQENIDIEINDNVLYVDTIIPGEYKINILAKAKNFEEKEYELIVKAVTPILKVDKEEPNYNEIHLNDSNIPLNLKINNINMDRVISYREENNIVDKDIHELVEYQIEYSKDTIDLIDNSIEDITIVPKAQGIANIKISIAVDGYEKYVYEKNFEVLPPQARFFPELESIDMDTTKSLRISYKTTDNTKVEFSYDKELLRINVGNTGFNVYALKEGSGEIVVKAFGEGLVTSTKTIPVKVTKDKMRLNISEEKIPSVLKRNYSISIGSVPQNAKIDYSISDSSKLELTLKDRKFYFKPIADGEVIFKLKITEENHDTFILEKKINIECPDIKLSMREEIIELNEGENKSYSVRKEPNTNINYTLKVVDEDICEANINNSGIVKLTAKKAGETELIIEGKKEGYTPFILKVPVIIGEKKTSLKVSGNIEAYPDFINEISYEMTDENATLTYETSDNIEVIHFKGGKSGKIKFKAKGDGTITLTASSPNLVDNVKVCNIYYLTKSIYANGMNILHLFDEDKNHTVYKHNVIMRNLFDVEPSISEKYPQTDGEELIELTKTVNSIIANKKTDMEKAFAIYEWITHNIYYDYDGLRGDGILYTTAYDVFKNRRGICDGYASLYSDMCRIAGIPARKIEGQYEYGDANWKNGTVNTHAWNEVWIDGRWVIVDSTWGTYYRYENGKFDNSKGVDRKHRFFNPMLSTFSQDHRIDTVEVMYN